MVIVPVSAGFLYSSTQEVNSSVQPTRVVLDTMSDAGAISVTDDVQQISSQGSVQKASDEDGKITDSAARIDKTITTE